MECINNIIIKSDKAYNNTKKLGDTEIFINSTTESVEHVNRIAEVVSVPEGTILEVGDKVIVHPSVMIIRNGTDGKPVESDHFIKDGLYHVPFDIIYAYKRGENSWKAVDPHCFIKPIVFEFEKSSLILDKKYHSYKGNVRNRGTVRYPNDTLEFNDIKQGDEIAFSDDSEFEFDVEGEVLYLMTNDDILGKII
jgi:co-chaperonin GroES (HSP10)